MNCNPEHHGILQYHFFDTLNHSISPAVLEKKTQQQKTKHQQHVILSCYALNIERNSKDKKVNLTLPGLGLILLCPFLASAYKQWGEKSHTAQKNLFNNDAQL